MLTARKAAVADVRPRPRASARSASRGAAAGTSAGTLCESRQRAQEPGERNAGGERHEGGQRQQDDPGALAAPQLVDGGRPTHEGEHHREGARDRCDVQRGDPGAVWIVCLGDEQTSGDESGSRDPAAGDERQRERRSQRVPGKGAGGQVRPIGDREDGE